MDSSWEAEFRPLFKQADFYPGEKITQLLRVTFCSEQHVVESAAVVPPVDGMCGKNPFVQ